MVGRDKIELTWLGAVVLGVLAMTLTRTQVPKLPPSPAKPQVVQPLTLNQSPINDKLYNQFVLIGRIQERNAIHRQQQCLIEEN